MKLLFFDRNSCERDWCTEPILVAFTRWWKCMEDPRKPVTSSPSVQTRIPWWKCQSSARVSVAERYARPRSWRWRIFTTTLFPWLTSLSPWMFASESWGETWRIWKTQPPQPSYKMGPNESLIYFMWLTQRTILLFFEQTKYLILLIIQMITKIWIKFARFLAKIFVEDSWYFCQIKLYLCIHWGQNKTGVLVSELFHFLLGYLGIKILAKTSKIFYFDNFLSNGSRYPNGSQKS